MMAPNSIGDRPWSFIVVSDKDKINAFAKKNDWASMFENAALAIVVCTVEKEGIMAGSEAIDCAAAIENILLQAVELGLGTCWNGLYVNKDSMHMIKDRIDAVTELVAGSLPKNEIYFGIISVGNPAENPEPRGWFEPEKVRYVKKQR
jgi:nitroreductase